jgi:hypothetical protein
MASSGMLRRVALVRSDVWEELSSSFIRVTRIGELGTTLAVTSNRRTLRRNTTRPKDFSSVVIQTKGLSFCSGVDYYANIRNVLDSVSAILPRRTFLLW